MAGRAAQNETFEGRAERVGPGQDDKGQDQRARQVEEIP